MAPEDLFSRLSLWIVNLGLNSQIRIRNGNTDSDPQHWQVSVSRSNLDDVEKDFSFYGNNPAPGALVAWEGYKQLHKGRLVKVKKKQQTAQVCKYILDPMLVHM